MFGNRRQELSDIDLVEQTIRGDDMAFDEIVKRYQNKVYNIVYRILGRQEDAREIALETFINAYRNLHVFRKESSFYTWLFRIAINQAKNRLRDLSRRGRNLNVSLNDCGDETLFRTNNSFASSPSPRAVAQTHELEEMLQNCLDELPEPLRTVFVLRVYEDLSYDEISKIVDCPEGTVKSRLYQARGLLRKRLSELSIL